MDLLKNPPEEWGQFESSGNYVNPSVNFIDNGTQFIVEVMAPGMSMRDFKVTVKNGKLSIEGFQNADQPANKHYIKQEFPHESIQFRRYFDLDPDINTNNFKKYYSRGILKVIFEKLQTSTKQTSYDLIKSN